MSLKELIKRFEEKYTVVFNNESIITLGENIFEKKREEIKYKYENLQVISDLKNIYSISCEYIDFSKLDEKLRFLILDNDNFERDKLEIQMNELIKQFENPTFL